MNNYGNIQGMNMRAAQGNMGMIDMYNMTMSNMQQNGMNSMPMNNMNGSNNMSSMGTI